VTEVGRYDVLGAKGRFERARDRDRMRDVLIERGTENDPRFVEDARTLAAAPHPALPTVHEVGEHEGRAFMAFEHVSGTSLERKTYPLGDATRWLTEIAEGLAHLHEVGLVHRDLKPESVVIDRTGHARLIDFGIGANVGEVDPQGSGSSGYVSAEQRAGEPADPRDDVFAFGRLASAILPSDRPRGWREIIREASEPRAMRIADGRQIVLRIPRPTNRWPLVALIAALVLAGGAFAAWRSTRPLPPAKVVPLTRRQTEDRIYSAAISPDGKHLVITDLHSAALIDIDAASERKIAAGACPFFAEDGASLWSGDAAGTIVRVDLDGMELEKSTLPACTAVSPKGDRAFGFGWTSPLVLHTKDAAPRSLERPADVHPVAVAWSRDGRRAAVIEAFGDSTGRSARLVVGDVERWTTLVEDRALVGHLGGAAVTWVGDDVVVFARQMPSGVELFEQDIDEPSARPLASVPGTNAESLSASEDGRRIVLYGSDDQADVHLADLTRAGPLVLEPFLASNGSEIPAAFSPPGDALWIMAERTLVQKSLVDGASTPLFADPGWLTWPVAADDAGAIAVWRLADQEAQLELHRGGETKALLTIPAPPMLRGGQRPPPFSHHLRCASGRCVLLERVESELHTTVLDRNIRGVIPISNQGDYGFALAPDGERLAVGLGSEISVWTVDGRELGRLATTGDDRCAVQFVTWDGPREALYATLFCFAGDAPYNLWHVPLVGLPERVWSSSDTWPLAPTVSSDGTHLAIGLDRFLGNAWLIQR